MQFAKFFFVYIVEQFSKANKTDRGIPIYLLGMKIFIASRNPLAILQVQW